MWRQKYLLLFWILLTQEWEVFYPGKKNKKVECYSTGLGKTVFCGKMTQNGGWSEEGRKYLSLTLEGKIIKDM